VDVNSQVDGPVATITTIAPLANKWRGFGWDFEAVDGHDVEALAAAFDAREDFRQLRWSSRRRTSRSRAINTQSVDGHWIKLGPQRTDAL
jgi:hypothetical protein